MNDSSRYRHASRTVIEALTKATLACSFYFIIGLHVYTAIVLAINNVVPELIWPTLVFDAFIGGSVLLLLIAAGKGQRGPVIEWLCFLLLSILCVFLTEWQYEFLDVFVLGYAYFPLPSTVLVIWMALILLSTGYVIGVGISSFVKFIATKARNIHRRSRKQLAVDLIVLASSLVLLTIALPVTSLDINEGTVLRTAQIADTNTNCTLAVWDIPHIPQLNGNTSEFNPAILTPYNKSVLTAFGKMNTTFFYSFSISDEAQQNWTIANLKMLNAYNLSVFWTIWYQNSNGFPGPDHPDDWIQSARKVMAFVINNHIPNVVGICMDSEARSKASPNAFWQNIDAYDSFLKEVQTNASLRRPSPAHGTFKTDLTTGDICLEDALDGDQDLVVNDRFLGLPPNSWTNYDFMLYRLDNSATPSYTYNFITLAKERFGTDRATPIVGLTGVLWFANGYFNGTCEMFGKAKQKYRYDGIDGWAAMKREILLCKAMGFHTVSVFHLNSYGDPSKIEGYGFLDYYGLSGIEDLANDWNAPKTISFPITSMLFSLSRWSFFNPNGKFQYDLLMNVEMIVTQLVLFAVISAVAMLALQRMKKTSRRD